MGTTSIQSDKVSNVWKDTRISKRFECPETESKK